MYVILAIDAQSFSSKTAKYAIEYAKAIGLDLLVMSVLSKKDMEENPRLVKFTMIVMSRIKTEAGDEGVEAKTLLEKGSPMEIILIEADRIGAKAIILGPTAKTGLDKFMIGSVSEGLIKAAKCPVVIVK
ncbi:MAG TPA: universal stress protein [Methanomassiliicoccales archaeon]|jgi:nucleotide-binding universal stress UspA family protein